MEYPILSTAVETVGARYAEARRRAFGRRIDQGGSVIIVVSAENQTALIAVQLPIRHRKSAGKYAAAQKLGAEKESYAVARTPVGKYGGIETDRKPVEFYRFAQVRAVAPASQSRNGGIAVFGVCDGDFICRNL